MSPSGSQDLVDEPVRWLRAAEQIIVRPRDRGRIVDGLTGSSQSTWSFSENARVSALLDVIGAAGALEAATVAGAAAETVVYEVLPDAVIATVGDTVVATGSLDASGTATVVVSSTWRRRGIGRAVFVMIAGVARHAGHADLLLLAPGDELSSSISEGGATLALLDSLGLGGLIKLKDAMLQIRISWSTSVRWPRAASRRTTRCQPRPERSSSATTMELRSTPIHRSPPAAPHHAGTLAALPMLDGQPERPCAGALPSHPPGVAHHGGHRRIRAQPEGAPCQLRSPRSSGRWA